jgi:hypothetical protein
LPDSSYRPRYMPPPDRHNHLLFQPSTQRHYPSLVFDVAVAHENRQRLLSDASEKYFHANTSVAVWVGVKIDIANNVFWAGWGRRANHGIGLRLEQQTEDKNGVSAFLAVNASAPIPGEFTISSALRVFGGVGLPQHAPVNFVIPLEEIRKEIEEGINLTGEDIGR